MLLGQFPSLINQCTYFNTYRLIVTSILSYMMYACVYKLLTPVDNSVSEETALVETVE